MDYEKMKEKLLQDEDFLNSIHLYVDKLISEKNSFINKLLKEKSSVTTTTNDKD